MLQPHERSVDPGRLVPLFRLLETSAPYRAVGLEVWDTDKQRYLCAKIDLDMELARENIRPRYLYDLGKVSYADSETDAHFLFASSDGRSLEYSAANVVRVLYRGRPVFEALPNTFGLQLNGQPDCIGFSKWRFWEESVRLP